MEALHSSCNVPLSFASCNASESSREGNPCVRGRCDYEEPHLAGGTSSLCLRSQRNLPQPNAWTNKCNLRASKIPKPQQEEGEKQIALKKKGISVPKLLIQCKSACSAWRSPERPKKSLIPLQPRKSAEVGAQSDMKSNVSHAEVHSLKEVQLEHNCSSSHCSKSCDPNPSSGSPEVTHLREEFLMTGAHMNPIYAAMSDEEIFTRGDLESYLHSGSGQPLPVGRCIRSVVERLLDVDGVDDKTPGTWLYEAKDVSNDPEKIVGPSSNVPWIRDFATISEVVGSADEADPQPVCTAGDQDFQAARGAVSDVSSELWDCEVSASAAEIQGLGTERDQHCRSDVGSSKMVDSTGIVQVSLGSWASSSNISSSSSSFSSPSGTLQQNTPANDPIEYEDSTIGTVLARACNQSNLVSLDYESVFIEDLLEPCWSEDREVQSEFEGSFEKENDFFAMEDTVGSSVLEWSFSSPRSDDAIHENKCVTHTGYDFATPLNYEGIDADWLEDDPQPSGFPTSGEESVSKTVDSGFRPLLLECLWSADVSFTEKQGRIEKQEGEYNSELVDSLSAYVDACAISLPKDMFDNPGPDTDESGVNLAIGSYFPNMLWSSENSEDDDEQLCDDFCIAERSIGICTSLGCLDEFTFTSNIESQHQKASQMLLKSFAEHVKGGALSWLPNSTGTIPGCPVHESVSTYSLSVRDWIMSTCSLKTNKDIRSIQTLTSSCASSLPCFTEVHIVDGCKFTGHNPLWIPRTDYEHDETQESKLACERQHAYGQWEVSDVSDDEEDPPLAGGSSFCSDTNGGILPQWAGAVGREKEDLCGNKIWYSPPRMGIASRLVRNTLQIIDELCHCAAEESLVETILIQVCYL